MLVYSVSVSVAGVVPPKNGVITNFTIPLFLSDLRRRTKKDIWVVQYGDFPCRYCCCCCCCCCYCARSDRSVKARSPLDQARFGGEAETFRAFERRLVLVSHFKRACCWLGCLPLSVSGQSLIPTPPLHYFTRKDKLINVRVVLMLAMTPAATRTVPLHVNIEHPLMHTPAGLARGQTISLHHSMSSNPH